MHIIDIPTVKWVTCNKRYVARDYSNEEHIYIYIYRTLKRHFLGPCMNIFDPNPSDVIDPFFSKRNEYPPSKFASNKIKNLEIMSLLHGYT
jgi:hypothetical protein